MLSSEFDVLDPQIKQLFMQHLQEHIMYIQQAQMQQMQAQMQQEKTSKYK